MPFDVTMPDGTVITDVPDGTTKAQLAAKYQGHLAKTETPQQPAQEASTATDVLRSIPGGLAKGAIAIMGLPGDLQQLIVGQRTPLDLPRSADIEKFVTAPTGGYYEPKTVPGQYAETVASFAPAALAPGSIPAKIARVAVPAAASETAGQLTKGTPAEPYARAAGGLVGGLAQGIGEGVMAERAASKAIPTTAQLKAAGSNAYKTSENAGLVISGNSFDKAVDDISTQLAPMGINSRLPPAAQARLYPKATAALEILQASKGADIGLEDLDKLRRVANVALTSPDKADRNVAHIIIDGIDDFVDNLKPTDVVAGNQKVATDELNMARELWAKSAKSQVIDRAIQKAKDSSSQFTGAGYENALRVQFRNLSKNERAMRQFSDGEQAAIRRVAAGGPVENILRFFGKFSPHGALTAMGTAGIGYEAGALPGALGALAAGEASRQAATALTARNARLASETVRSGAPVARQLQAPTIRNALAAGLIGRPINAFTAPEYAQQQ